MAGLFGKKKKDESSNTNNNQQHNATNSSNTNTQNSKQRPAPPPNGLGLNNLNGAANGNNNGHSNAYMSMNMQPQTSGNGFGLEDPANNYSQPYQHSPPPPPGFMGSAPQSQGSVGPGAGSMAHNPPQDGGRSLHHQQQQQQQQQLFQQSATRSVYGSSPTASASIPNPQLAPPPPSNAAPHVVPSSGTAPLMTTSAVATSATLPTPRLFWTRRSIIGSNPFPRFQHSSSITLTGTDIFVFGGTHRGTPKSDLFVLDSVTFQCQAVSAAGADPPMPKSGHTAVNIGQYVIYFGGWDATTGQCDDSLHVLHTSRREWNRPTIQGTLPTPRHSHAGCSVGTTMYIFGGQVDNYYLGDIISFDMKTITQNPHWESIEPQSDLPPARSGHTASVYDSKIYVFGGADADYFYNDIWCFDTRALTWTPIPASGYLPSGRFGHSSTLVEGVLYIFGGSSPDGTELNDAYAFKIHERRWYLFQNEGPTPSPRSGHTMCTIKDKVFVLGGESEQNTLDDVDQVFSLELSSIRFPDLAAVPPRQVSSAKLVPSRPTEVAVGQMSSPAQSFSDSKVESNNRISDPTTTTSRLDRPERPDRPARSERHTQRPESPASFTSLDRQGSTSSSRLHLSQQPSQATNAHLGQRAVINSNGGSPYRENGNGGHQTPVTGAESRRSRDSQDEEIMASHRRTLLNGSGAHTAISAATSPSSQGTNRRTMHLQQQQQQSPGDMGRMSPTMMRSVDRIPSNASESVPPSSRQITGPSNGQTDYDLDPYASEAVVPAYRQQQQTQPQRSRSGSIVSVFPPPPRPAPPGSSSPALQNLPPPPTTPSPPVSSSIALPTSAGFDKRAVNPAGLPPQPPKSTKSGHAVHNESSRSPSPGTPRATGRVTPTHPTAGTPPHLTSTASFSQQQQQPDMSSADALTASHSKMAALESKVEVAQESYSKLQRQMSERDEELNAMRRRENWLVTEVLIGRQGERAGGARKGSIASLVSDQGSSTTVTEKRQSMADLEKELELQPTEGLQFQMTKALLKIKEELRHAKMSIVMQAQAATFKIKEAERVRTGALQEAAYLKAKLSSMSNAQQDPGALARVEMDRAADLEKRLTVALGELELVETQYASAQENLHREKQARILAEERSNGSSILADQAQTAHTRALAELASLHNRAAKAEAEAMESATLLAETQAGYSGHRSQSTGMTEKIEDLKQQLEEHQMALERTQMAYSAANERAMRSETLCDETSDKLERLENARTELSSELLRSRGETERLQSKVEELESRWQISKDEVITLRKLVEDGLGAFNPRGKSQPSPERKHDSIAIMTNVSKVSELEHELSSLRVLLKSTQSTASRSAEDLAKVMIELSQLEQSSMQARSESISLQKLLAEEQQVNAQLQNELHHAEQEGEKKVKELESHEVQLGLLKDVMREKGLLAEDIMLQSAIRGSGDYTATLESRVREAEERSRSLTKELEQTRVHFTTQLESFEVQRQATVQHSEKSSHLLRKFKNDLAATTKEKEAIENELKILQEAHKLCGDERDLGHAREEDRQELGRQMNELQNSLMESELHATELSQKVMSMTERMQELGQLNEVLSEEVESIQEQRDGLQKQLKEKEANLLQEIDRLKKSLVKDRESVQTKHRELENAFRLNQDLESQLEQALHAQISNVSASSNNAAYKDLESRLMQAQETIQILEGDNSVLEARLVDSEKKVALLLEDMQNSPTTVVPANLTPKTQNGHSSAASGRYLGASPGGQSVPTKANSPNHNFNNEDEDEEEDDLYPQHHVPLNTNPVGNGLQYQNGHSHGNYFDSDDDDEDDNNPKSRAYRDSVDSITRELELLKVPWNKNPAGHTGGNSHTSSMTSLSSLASSSVPGQKAAQGNGVRPKVNGYATSLSKQTIPNGAKQGAHQNNNPYGGMNHEGDEDSDDDHISYLAHLHPRPNVTSSPVPNGNGRKGLNYPSNQVVDTHSLNDRSPSRLKEYEQMIDEIENARKQN